MNLQTFLFLNSGSSMGGKVNILSILFFWLSCMCLSCRCLTPKGEATSVFLKIIDLFDGKAETIEKALIDFCDEKKIPIRKVMGFGSDGASAYLHD